MWNEEHVAAQWDGLVAIVGEHVGFAVDRCESCGDGGGDRYAVEYYGMMSDDDRGGETTVCETCALWLANGDVPA